MAEVKPLKLVDVGGGLGELRELAAGDTLPSSNLAANLAAFAGLAGVADRLPYFTGAGALNLATLTTKARTLLDDADATAMQATLELVKQTSASDATAGRVLLPGAFGLGQVNSSIDIPGDNLDSLRTNGMWRITSTTVGTPLGVNIGQVLHMGQTSNYAVQLALQTQTPAVAKLRVLHNNIWQAWVTLWDSSTLIKQSSAVDTGVGRVLLTGAFGLGGTLIATDMDTPSGQPTGLYTTLVGTTTLTPPTGLDANGIVYNQIRAGAGASAQTFQLWLHQSSGRLFFRSAYGNTWTTWREVWGSSTPWVEGAYPAINYLTDSGRFTGKINPALLTISNAWTSHGFFSSYNGTTQADGGKYVSDNSTYGGPNAALPQDVIDLLAAMGKNNAGAGRYGPEFYLTNFTMGSGTLVGTTGSDSATRYLMTVNNSRAYLGPSGYMTLSFWIRAKSGSVHIAPSNNLFYNGQAVTLGQVLTANQWTHVRCIHVNTVGYDNAFPRIYAANGSVIQIALPVLLPGNGDVGVHKNPIPTLNELSS